MATRYEAIDAGAVVVSLAREGEQLGLDQVGYDRLALVLSYDEVVYIEGTKLEILNFLADALTLVVEEIKG